MFYYHAVPTPDTIKSSILDCVRIKADYFVLYPITVNHSDAGIKEKNFINTPVTRSMRSGLLYIVSFFTQHIVVLFYYIRLMRTFFLP